MWGLYWICLVLPSFCDCHSVIPWPFRWKFSPHFSPELWGQESWNLVHTWTVGDYIVLLESGCWCLSIPLFLHFSFSPIFKHQKFLSHFSQELLRPKLKLGTHMDNGWLYRVYQNQAALAYSSLYFFIFLSLQLSNIKRFGRLFLRNCEDYNVETWYTRGQWVDVSCVPESSCCFLFIPLFLHFSFSPIFKN